MCCSEPEPPTARLHGTSHVGINQQLTSEDVPQALKAPGLIRTQGAMARASQVDFAILKSSTQVTVYHAHYSNTAQYTIPHYTVRCIHNDRSIPSPWFDTAGRCRLAKYFHVLNNAGPGTKNQKQNIEGRDPSAGAEQLVGRFFFWCFFFLVF